MPNYFYKAKNLQGKGKSGSLFAQTESQLAALLRKEGYILISAHSDEDQEKAESSKNIFSIFNRFQRVSHTDKLFFTKNLEIMVRTGVPLPRAFKILSAQSKNEKFKEVLKTISEKISEGESLSKALENFPSIFSNLYCESLKIAEETGKVENILKILANQMEKEHYLTSRLKTAMVYPIFVLSMTLAIGILMMIVAVPRIEEAFTQLNVKLPFTTRVVLSSANFLVHEWLLSIAIFVGLIFLAIVALRSKKTSKLKSMLAIRLPFVSKLTKETNSALALRTLSSLLSAGVPIVRSLEVAAGALTNFYFQESFRKAARIVEKGQKVSEALEPYEKLYSPMVLQMVKVGEETGESSKVLAKLADFYEEGATNDIERLSSIIEPILIMFVGGIVGVFVISMFQPMFSIMQGIK